VASNGPPDDRGGLGPPPAIFRIKGERPPFRAARWLLVAAILIALFVAASVGKGIYADYLWFDSLGYASVYRTQIVAKVVLFLIGALLFLALITANLLLARRLAPVGLEESFIADVEPETLRHIVTIGLIAGSLFFAVVFGGVAAGNWDVYLRWANAVRFGVSDPQFHKDVGFFIFTLPALHVLQGWLLGATLVALVAVVGVYGFVFSLQNFEIHLGRGVRAHIGALLIVLLLLFVFGYVLSIFDLDLSTNGRVQGATYTDLHARLPGYIIVSVFALGTIVGVVYSIVRGGLIAAGIGAAAWIASLIVVLGIYPAIVQRVTVVPNELAKEEPYISRNIDMTRRAFDLAAINEQQFDASGNVTAQTVSQDQDTFDNIRLWDPRVELNTYQQQQEIQQFYNFDDVDVDRYNLNGSTTEVTLSARELTTGSLPADSKGWVNIHLQYTHGYGAVINPVNKIDQYGLPQYSLQNIPPQGQPQLTQPRIYYGQQTNDWVIVDAQESEFDYRTDQGLAASTTYKGSGGIGIGSFLRRLVFAWQLGDTNILLSGQIQGSSRLLIHRNIQERVSHIAPFLTLDKDPYLVVANGGLYWIQDAYTTSNNFPYSQTNSGGYNYIRNSVKVVIDAYSGATTIYLADPTDPIAQTYQKIYPGLLHPLDQMPAELRQHLRYPEDLFTAQADAYRQYHMTDPGVFYRQDDLWATPKEGAQNAGQDVMPYYLIMRLPGQQQAEFVLIRPFTPANKPNAIALMAAQMDGPNYGKLSVFRFPSGRVIPGPAQVEQNIDSQPAISQKFSLLNVQGSSIKRGNLLFVPVGESYLYVEPVYLQGEQNPKPAVIAVIVYANGNVYMEPTLSQALAVALGQATPTYAVGQAAVANAAGAQAASAAATPAASGTPGGAATPPAGASPRPAAPPPSAGTPGPTPSATDIPGLIREAQADQAQADSDLRAGNFAAYGDDQARLRADLARLGQLIATPTPSAPAPSPTP
jgi:uncharacterized membrane protein (UPF0182 family)